MQKGQVSVEYLIIIGIILVITIPLFYYALREPARSLKANQAADTVNVLARKADSIYALGPGSRDYVWVSIPGSVTNSLVGNRSILLRLSDFGDVVGYTRANVTGYLPTNQGTYRVVVENLESLVYIGPINDTVPPIITTTAPSGTITITNPILSATTNEPARCKFSTSDTLYDTMPNTFVGAGIAHTYPLTSQPEATYNYYARCRDNFNNTMTSSAPINFTISLDITKPIVRDVNATPRRVQVGSSICVNATVTDTSPLDRIWVMLTAPLTAPYNAIQNFTLSDIGSSCAGSAGDNTYGSLIPMQVVGENTANTVFANDSAGNIGSQTPHPNILINVTSNVSVGPGQGLTYVVIDKGWYYKTPDNGNFTMKDSQISLSDATLDLTDDDKNTPPSTKRFRYTTVKNVYEGFVLQLNRSKNDVDYVSLRLKVVDSDIIPYNLTVYAYSDNDALLLTNSTTFRFTNIVQTGVNRGFNEYMITSTVKAGGSTYIKVRVVPDVTMHNTVSHISEADFGVA